MAYITNFIKGIVLGYCGDPTSEVEEMMLLCFICPPHTCTIIGRQVEKFIFALDKSNRALLFMTDDFLLLQE